MFGISDANSSGVDAFSSGIIAASIRSCRSCQLLTFGWMLQGDWSGHVPQILTSVGIWVVLPLAAGLMRALRREVK